LGKYFYKRIIMKYSVLIELLLSLRELEEVDLATPREEKEPDEPPFPKYAKCICKELSFAYGKIYKFNEDGYSTEGWAYNPDQFLLIDEVDYKKQELLKEAKKRYPAGTRFYPAHLPDNMDIPLEKFVSTGEFSSNEAGNFIIIPNSMANSYRELPIFYQDGKWATIISNFIETEDKVVLFPRAYICRVYIQRGHKIPKYSFDKIIFNKAEELNPDKFKYFSTMESATKWILKELYIKS
jgi:hypothetical protein